MLRNTIIAATSALALTAAHGATAQSGSPEASTGTGTEVGSQKQLWYESYLGTGSPEVGNAPAQDTQSIGISNDAFKVLANAKGEPMMTNDGTPVGIIQEVDFNVQGNPELVVNVSDRNVIDADRLVVTVLPNNFNYAGDQLILDSSLAELKLKARENSISDSEGRVEVTVF